MGGEVTVGEIVGGATVGAEDGNGEELGLLVGLTVGNIDDGAAVLAVEVTVGTLVTGNWVGESVKAVGTPVGVVVVG